MTASHTGLAPSRRAWIEVGVAWVVAVAVLAGWLLGSSTGELREHLKVWQFWSLELCVVLALLSGLYAIRQMRPRLGRSDAGRMAALVAIAVGLTVLVAPRTNRIFYDEQIYQSIGQNMSDLRRAQICNDGNVEAGRLQCLSGEYNKQPYAYPHLLSLGYRLFGVHEGIASAVNAAAMAAAVCAVYLLVWVLFSDRDAALFAGLCLALTPQQILWSATAAVEPTASLALVAAMLLAALYLRAGGQAALTAAAIAAAYAIQFRPESLLILPVIAFLIWPRLRGELSRPETWWIGLLFAGLAAAHIGHLFAVRHVGWGTDAPRFSLDYVAANLRVNGWFYLYDERFPLVFTLLACLGLSIRGFTRERVATGVYFLVFFGIGLVFYAGSYDYGADVRYSLMTYPPIAVAAGLGAARLGSILVRGNSWIPVRLLILAGLAFQFLWYAPVVRATTDTAWAARADVRFARSFVPELPRNAYVLTHNPGMFHLWGVNAGQMSQASSGYITLLKGRYPGGVYVHWNFWCNVQDPVQPEFCRRALAIDAVELVRESTERDQRFAFYRMTKTP
jgi:4-amino-4-deoxy-L-arabinose transferase-like glycosyltransferase